MKITLSTYLFLYLIIFILVSIITIILYVRYSYLPYHRAMRKVSRVSKRVDRRLTHIAKKIIEESKEFDLVSVQKAQEMLKK